jgi:hypothetical protein
MGSGVFLIRMVEALGITIEIDVLKEDPVKRKAKP